MGGSTYQVPVEVSPERRQAPGDPLDHAVPRSGHEKSLWSQRLAGEILDAPHDRGATVKKREDAHQMAEASKAFAHYRW